MWISNTQRTEQQRRQLRLEDAISDAAIVAGATFFTTLGSGSVAGIPTREAVVASAISAAAQFFVWLTIKRGLREKQ